MSPQRLGAGLKTRARTTGDNLSQLNERLAVIDAAQARLTGMTAGSRFAEGYSGEQADARRFRPRAHGGDRARRPAFGRLRFSSALQRGAPDCVIRLPGDPRVLAVDAKFPLEAFTAFKEARDGEARKKPPASACAPTWASTSGTSRSAISSPGETQDIALMFVPSKSIWADLAEHFDDVVQKAHRAQIVIVSPSLLMMAIQVTQTILRDAPLRESAASPSRPRSANS